MIRKLSPVEALSAISGLPAAEVREQFEIAKATVARWDACIGHTFEPTRFGYVRCVHCEREVNVGVSKAYEQGVRHGRGVT